MEKVESYGYLITIEDPTFKLGKSISKVIQLLLQIIDFKFIILNDLEGSGPYGVIYSLKQKMNEILDLRETSKVFDDLQFEWGDFFLFKEYPDSWQDNGDMFYPPLIAQTDTTIRAIDSQYIYIYTSYKEIVDLIMEKYLVESVITNTLDNLSYPY